MSGAADTAPDGQPAALAALDAAGLDALMPLAVIVTRTGHIRHAGPTLAKLRQGRPLVGQRFLEVFHLRRPRNVTGLADLVRAGAGPLDLQFRDAPPTALKGQCIPLDGEGGVLINLSFGIGVVPALETYDLTAGDFPRTDLTVEVLYLVEANAAVQGELKRLNRRLQGAKIAAQEQAYTDTLTGLRNRRAMDAVLGRYAKGREAFGLMHLDLDYFKDVNDTLGHAAGDAVLQNVARILVEETREADTVVRAGGDEFVLIFHRMTDRKRLARVAARLLNRLEQPVMFDGTPCRISGSIGIAVSNDYDGADIDRMQHDADRALYASKNGGRGRFCFTGDTGPAAAASPA